MSDEPMCYHCQRFDEQHTSQHYINTKQAKEIEVLKARIVMLEKVKEKAKQLNSRLRYCEPWLGIFSDNLEEALKQAGGGE